LTHSAKSPTLGLQKSEFLSTNNRCAGLRRSRRVLAVPHQLPVDPIGGRQRAGVTRIEPRIDDQEQGKARRNAFIVIIAGVLVVMAPLCITGARISFASR